MTGGEWLSLGLSLGLAGLHVVAGHLRFLHVMPRSRYLSAAGGVSIAYVFVHLLPELAKWQEHVGDAATALPHWLEKHLYLLALVGFATFYCLERAAHHSRRRQTQPHESSATDNPSGPSDAPPTPPSIFWMHVASFAIYNALIGYLLLNGGGGESGSAVRPASSMIWFAVAMGLHFAVNDYGLHEHHQRRYRRYGRWLLGGAIIAGWVVGVFVHIEPTFIGALIALLAGGIILNVIKEELPAERESRGWAFLAGAIAYTALLLAV